MTDIEERIEHLEKRLTAIEERNRRVETHKAWELSGARKVSLILLTYFVMYLVFSSLGSEPAWKNAIIPTLGFFLSTLSIPYIRDFWERSRSNS